MNKIQCVANTLYLVCLESALVYFIAGCAEVAPTSYWVKSGVSQEQIRKDNMFCADMTAQKPSMYSRGERFYYAPLDQPAYQNCMRSQGYRMVTKEELQRGVLAAAPEHSLVQLEATRKLCRRVVGEVGDVESCIRWMSMYPTRTVLPAPQSEYHDSLERRRITTSISNDDMNVCLRHDSTDARNLKMTMSRSCDPHEADPPSLVVTE
jgi:hypothetical protein